MSHIPVVVTGWIRETTAFEALKDYTPSDNIYATMVASLHGRMALSNARRSPAPSTSESPGPQPLQIDNSPTTNPSVQLSASSSAEQPSVGSASTIVSVDHRLLLDLCTRALASSAKQVLLSVFQADKHCSANPNFFQKTTLNTSSVAPTACKRTTDLRQKLAPPRRPSTHTPPTSYVCRSHQYNRSLTISSKPNSTSNVPAQSLGPARNDVATGLLGSGLVPSIQQGQLTGTLPNPSSNHQRAATSNPCYPVPLLN
jgi:hypothetical protein